MSIAVEKPSVSMEESAPTPSVPAAPAEPPSNSYVIRPNFTKKFRAGTVKAILQQVLQSELSDKVYVAEEAPDLTKHLSDTIKLRLKEMECERYKFVVQVVIGEQRGEGVKMTCRAFWDSDSDDGAEDDEPRGILRRKEKKHHREKDRGNDYTEEDGGGERKKKKSKSHRERDDGEGESHRKHKSSRHEREEGDESRERRSKKHHKSSRHETNGENEDESRDKSEETKKKKKKHHKERGGEDEGEAKRRVEFNDDVRKDYFKPDSPFVEGKDSPAQQTAGGGGGGDDYANDDDFEDYEDDFEDFDDEDSDASAKQREIESIAAAIKSENSGKFFQGGSDKLVEESTYQSTAQFGGDMHFQSRGHINFMAAFQKEADSKSRSKTRKRAADLLKLIELDNAKFDILDMPPIGEYDLYMRNFGKLGSKQVGSQTELPGEAGCQTDEIDYLEKWSQHPPEDSMACGGQSSRDVLQSNDLDIDSHKTGARFLNFVDGAGRLFDRLLDELTVFKLTVDTVRESDASLGDFANLFGYLNIPKNISKHNHQIVHIAFHPLHLNILLTCHCLSDVDTSGTSFVAVWNTFHPAEPDYLLKCEGQAHRALFSPHSKDFVLAGLTDGGVLAFDLREPDSLHKRNAATPSSITERHPTYDTRGALSSQHWLSKAERKGLQKSSLHGDNEWRAAHTSPVVDMQIVGGDASSADSGVSCELVTLDDAGRVACWTVIEDPVVSSAFHTVGAGSLIDLGLSPGGRLRLVLTSVIEQQTETSRLQAQCLAVSPSHSSHYYLGGMHSGGGVLHTTRFKGTPFPDLHIDEDALDGAQCDSIACVAFHRFVPTVFLAAGTSPRIRLFHTDRVNPLFTFDLPPSHVTSSVVYLSWSPSQPHVFVAYTSDQSLFIFNVLQHDSNPLERIDLRSATSNSAHAVPSVVALSSITASEKRSKKRPVFAVSSRQAPVGADESLTCQLYFMSKRYCEAKRTDLQKFDDLITDLLAET